MMLPKTFKKIRLCLVSSSVVALLAACSPANPLKTAEPKVSAQFLVSASQAAEKKLRIFNAPGGYYYGECMNGKEKKALCNKLYQAMADYARGTTTFSTLSVSNLTDPNVFAKLKAEYQREQFNSV